MGRAVKLSRSAAEGPAQLSLPAHLHWALEAPHAIPLVLSLQKYGLQQPWVGEQVSPRARQTVGALTSLWMQDETSKSMKTKAFSCAVNGTPPLQEAGKTPASVKASVVT